MLAHLYVSYPKAIMIHLVNASKGRETDRLLQTGVVSAITPQAWEGNRLVQVEAEQSKISCKAFA